MTFSNLNPFYILLFDYRSQFQQEPSLLQGFEEDIIIEKHKKSDELILPDLLISSSYANGTPSKSAPTPRIYYENRSNKISVFKFLN